MSGRHWSEDEDRVVRWAWFRGIRRKAICGPLGRSHEAIRKRQRELGLLAPGTFDERRSSTACAKVLWAITNVAVQGHVLR